MRSKTSLRWRIPLALVCSIVPMIFALSYWHYQVEYENLIERSQLKGRIAMNAFAGLVMAGLVNHEEKTLEQAVNSVSQFPCFSRALGLDNRGRVFLSSSRDDGVSAVDIEKAIASRLPQSGDSLIRMDRDDTLVEVFRRLTMPKLYDLRSPMAGGWLYLELDIRQDLAKYKSTILTQSAVASGVVIGVSLWLWLWLSRRLTKPLMRLAEAVGSGGGSSLSMRVQEESCCLELSELSKGFASLGNELTLRYASLKRQRMLYQALSKTNQIILHSRDEEGVLSDVCEAVVSAGIDLVWIGYIDKPSEQLSIVHTAGEKSGWLSTVQKHIGIEQDPLVRMVKQRAEGVVVIDDEHCKVDVWYAEARLNGFSVGACFPIYRSGSMAGGLVVMSGDKDLLDDDGRLLLREMASDIGFALSNFDRESQRMRMEQNLSRERGLLRALVDTIPDIIFFKDSANSYLGCNEAFEEIVAMDESKLIGGTDKDIFSPRLAAKFHEEDMRILASGIEERNEVRFDKPNGGRVYLDLLKAPFRDANGSVVGLVGIGRDVTSELQVRRELQQAMRLMKQAEKISHIGSWVYDAETQVMSWSEMMYRVLGVEEENPAPGFELLIERCHPQDREALQQSLDKLLKGDVDIITQSYRMRLADGDVRYLISRASHCSQTDQRPAYIVGTVQDVTPEDAHDQDHKDKIDRRRSQQRLLLIGELTADALHELNDVMTPILGFAQLAEARETCSADTIREYLKRIREAATRGGHLLSKLTAISQARKHERSELCDLRGVCREVVELLEAVAPATVRINARFGRDLPRVQIDAADFKQIALALALRAKDALAGAGELRMSLRALPYDTGDGPTPCVELAVEGLREASPEASELPPAVRSVGVYGEGALRQEILSMLINLYGGVLHADRVPGRLECFRLLLPAPLAPELGAVGAKSPAKPDAAPGEGRRVLLVDDEESVTLYVQEYLQWKGFEVEGFTDSRQALECFLRDPGAFDLLITDQIMPGIDGLQLIAAVHELRGNIPVILCSGYCESVDQANAEAHGILAFLQKPVSLNDLLHAVERSLLPRVD